jgi:hypothetical protein
MEIIEILESIEIKNSDDLTQLIERLKFWHNKTRDSKLACTTSKRGNVCRIVLVSKEKKPRKTRSDAGKERVNRTGFRRGMNPLPRNLDKLPKFYNKD